MTIKPAQEAFDRQEILEILNRNIQLYRDEVGFASYLVDLTMFLLDQHYEKGRISPWEAPEPPSGMRKLSPATALNDADRMKMPPTVAELQSRGARGQEPSDRHQGPFSPPASLSPHTPLPIAAQSDQRTSSSGRIRISGVFPSTSSLAGRQQEVDIDPQSGRFRVSNEGNTIPPAASGASSGLSSRFEVEASPLVTPASPAMRERNKMAPRDLDIDPPDAEIDPPSSQRRTGFVKKNAYGEIEPPQANKSGEPQKPSSLRRSSFQMYRTAQSQSNVDIPCPSCGLRVPIDSKQCPGCGHFL
ncbi:zinc ribbon domain-containing protein [Candidatus Sumerlaeota bacterium]|nr:zinc ribbon domain-containing protein [Candidatus Sumerlaeota bacterium]